MGTVPPRLVMLRQLVAVLSAVLTVVCPLQGQTLELRFFDVGQGDAALIVTPEGKKVLVDAGPGPWPVVPYLQSKHYDTLDLVITSHNHADHIGGMASALSTTVVRYYLDNGIPHTTATYQRTIQAVEASGAQYLQPTARTITVGSARLRVLPPPPGQTDQNDGSVGILLEYGQFRALLTGDSELYELGYWLGHDSIPQVQVLKVAHHGSWNGSSEAWAARTRPQAAVISVGAHNRYGHPSPSVVALWSGVGARVYRTDQDGSIVIQAQTDGSFTVTTGSGETTSDTMAPRPGARAAPADSSPAPLFQLRPGGVGHYQCHRPPGCACDASAGS